MESWFDSAAEGSNLSRLQDQIESLQRHLQQTQAEIEDKNQTISSLERQVQRETEKNGCKSEIEAKLDSFIRATLLNVDDDDDDEEDSISTTLSVTGMGLGNSMSDTLSNVYQRSRVPHLRGPLTPIQQGSVHGRPSADVSDIVNEIQTWLLAEGSDLPNVETLLAAYCAQCRATYGIPLDRLFVAGMTDHPTVSDDYVWKWEVGQDFTEQKFRRSDYGENNWSRNEPFFTELMEGRAMECRMKASDGDDVVPSGCAWFGQNNYQDYVSRPVYHRGTFVGAIAWSTKSISGFSEEDVIVFNQCLSALSTVLRLHISDIVVATLTSHSDLIVEQRTKELEETNRQLAAGHAKVTERSQMQLKHFAMMSHEIRTPLNCIVGMSNLLLEGSSRDTMHPDVEESIRMITNSGDLLLAVVDDVLDYSKLASGNVEIDVSPTRLRRMLRPMLESIRLKTRTTGLELRTNISNELPEWIETDGRRLQQILYNLLGNAAKFGVKGKYVDFSVQVEQSEEATRDRSGHGQNVVFRVKDYGKGIPDEDMMKIFQPFQQSNSNDPTSGGTGLGLAIARQLCKVLGGSISVKSEVGKWCEFIVTFPLIVSEEPSDNSFNRSTRDLSYGNRSSRDLNRADSSNTLTASVFSELSLTEASAETDSATRNNESSMQNLPFETEISRDPSQQESTKCQCSPQKLDYTKVDPVVPPAKSNFSDVQVLIAEDNLINQKVLVRTLQNIGLTHIDVVGNGQLAVEQSAAKLYDIIFMDWQMPVMDGYEATCVIKGRRKNGLHWDNPVCENDGETDSTAVERHTSNDPRIVFLTAHALNDYKEMAIEAGGDGFISKPFKSGAITSLMASFGLGQP
jgi:signal transduction histidine kinase/CheY-like chemotaxis protein